MTRYTHEQVAAANRRYYDIVGKKYRENESYAYSQDIIREVTRNLKHYASLLDRRNAFLDFGCGSGFLSEIVHSLGLFQFSAGIDISRTQAEIYRNRLPGAACGASLADITKLPFRDNTFDMAACYSVLHHILDYRSAVLEVTRVLRGNGLLYIDFEPTQSFRRLLTIPLHLHRRITKKKRGPLMHLEYLSEYHHNIKTGIDRKAFVQWLQGRYQILEVGPRYPQFLLKPLFRRLFKLSWAFSPYFYVMAKKIEPLPGETPEGP